MKKLLARPWHEENGADTAEYALMFVMICLVTVAVLKIMRTSLHNTYAYASGTVASLSAHGAPDGSGYSGQPTSGSGSGSPGQPASGAGSGSGGGHGTGNGHASSGGHGGGNGHGADSGHGMGGGNGSGGGGNGSGGNDGHVPGNGFLNRNHAK